MTALTPEGRVWAEKHLDDIVANVALFGEGWPTAFVETSREIANEQGQQALLAAKRGAQS